MIVKEGSAVIEVSQGKVCKKLPVFFNEEMKLGRDVAVYIVSKLKPKRVLDAMSASGVRAIRFVKEAGIKHIVANDVNPLAARLVSKNAAANNIDIDVRCAEINSMNEPFDYIDIDPFGSPLPYVESASKNLAKNGIMAVTATDLGVLFGKYPKKCKRLYGASSLLTGPYKEFAARILIRKIQLVANKPLLPVFTHLSSHYLRLYLKNVSSLKEDYGKVCPNYLSSNCRMKAGPMWMGQLWDKSLVKWFNLVPFIFEESKVNSIGYYNVDKVAKKYKIPKQRKIADIVKLIQDKGFKASRTHFDLKGVKTDIGSSFSKVI